MVFSVWAGIAAAVLLIRYAPRRPGTWVMVLAGVVVVTAARLSFPSSPFWYPVFDEDRTAAASRFRLTQEIMEAQPGVLEDALHGLEPERAGVIDLYAITFAPYAEEDVFRRESRLVADVMADRFDAAGRTVQLLNHQETATTLPWATPLNLQRTIARVAKVMNPQEDVLFIHLTSHGGADGKLAARMRPMDLDPVTPAALRQWLDDAHVRYAVISVSACYSGSWIAPLSGDGTLVMTAADAEHTSYGCGHLSELTYFGRAVYDEALRNTRSFEQAHATARTVIERREQEAGKSDGYSNPQISVGPGIRAVLGRLEARLDEGGR